MNHESVLFSEVLEHLAPPPGGVVLDCTLGLGGHSQALLEKAGNSGQLVAIDADEQNLSEAQENLRETEGAKTFFHANFSELEHLDIPECDTILADLGVSSPHFDDPERGFSFRFEGPLDLRFNRSSGWSAAEYLERTSENDIGYMFKRFGELRQARKLAEAIKKDLPQTTTDLVSLVEQVCGFRAKDVLPQVFQALRIAVNDELGALEILLRVGPQLLKPGGKMGIISFHSLEDRAVKQAFKALCEPKIDDYTGQIITEAPYELITKKPIVPSEAEVEQNPRSRSAKFRVIQKR